MKEGKFSGFEEIIKSSRTHGLDQLWLGWGRKRLEILFVWGFVSAQWRHVVFYLALRMVFLNNYQFNIELKEHLPTEQLSYWTFNFWTFIFPEITKPLLKWWMLKSWMLNWLNVQLAYWAIDSMAKDKCWIDFLFNTFWSMWHVQMLSVARLATVLAKLGWSGVDSTQLQY